MDENEKPEEKPDDTPEQKPEEKPEVETPETPPETVSRADFEAAQAELKTLRDAKTAREEAELSEKERAEKRANDAAEQVTAKDATIRRLSILNGIRDSAATAKLDLDMEAVRDLYAAGAFKDVKVDENGDAIGLPEFVKDLVKKKSYLVKPGENVKAPDIGAGKTGAETPGEKTEAEVADLKRRFRV